VLYVAAAAALVVHALEARSGSKARFAPFIGMAGAGAVYLSTHPNKDTFAAVFGAFFVALFIGGGVGLFAGELLGRAFKKA
jgi:NAD/NADP transhydrogenase beta subunit